MAYLESFSAFRTGTRAPMRMELRSSYGTECSSPPSTRTPTRLVGAMTSWRVGLWNELRTGWHAKDRGGCCGSIVTVCATNLTLSVYEVLPNKRLKLAARVD